MATKRIGLIALCDILALVDVNVQPTDLIKWSQAERLEALEWAVLERVAASDGPPNKRTKPAHVAQLAS